MTITTGDSLPDTKLVKVTEGGPEQVSAADYFKGRKVALFSVPGAFTPTCSAKHLPGFVEKAAELKAKGIDEIVCTAVSYTHLDVYKRQVYCCRRPPTHRAQHPAPQPV